MINDLYEIGHKLVVDWAKEHPDLLPRLAALDLTVCIWENDFEIMRELRHVVYCKTVNNDYIIGNLVGENLTELHSYMSYITEKTPKYMTVNGKEFRNITGDREIIHSALNYIGTILSIGELEGNEQG